GKVVLAHAEHGAELEIAGPLRIDPHALDAHAVGGDVIGGGDGNAMRHGGAGTGSVALHALVAVDQGSAPVGLHGVGGEEHVVVGLAHAVMVFALVVPPRGLLGRLV